MLLVMCSGDLAHAECDFCACVQVLKRKLMLVDEIKADPRRDAQAYAGELPPPAALPLLALCCGPRLGSSLIMKASSCTCGLFRASFQRVVSLRAERVARGFRPQIPSSWPENLRELIAACWAQVRPRSQ